MMVRARLRAENSITKVKRWSPSSARMLATPKPSAMAKTVQSKAASAATTNSESLGSEFSPERALSAVKTSTPTTATRFATET